MECQSIYRSEQPSQGLRLNLNEAPRDLPEALRREILERLNDTSWRRYPDGEMKRCRRMIGEWYELDENSVLLGNGSNELLGAAMLAYAPPGGQIFWISPGFSMVPRQAAWLGRRLVEEPLNCEDFSFPSFTGSTALHGADMVLLTSPNNPTGTCLPKAMFEDLMSRYAGPVLIDEAYGEFADGSYLQRLQDFPNLIVLRTFSKALALAGARIGYALSSPGMIARLEACKPPFSVGLFQQACVEAVSRSRAWVDEAAADIRRERAIVTSGLRSLVGFRVIDSQANFVLFSPGEIPPQTFLHRLKQEKIWIRSFEEPTLRDWFRVSIGTAQENRIFLQAVAKMTRELEP